MAQAGLIELLVANAGIAAFDSAAWETEQDDWWRLFEVNVLGVYLCCCAVIAGMLERGAGRIAITGSGAAFMPMSRSSGYAASKAAVCRFGEILAKQLEGRIPVFIYSPGLVRTEMTNGKFPDDAPWTPPERAADLVCKLASGRYDRLAGAYLQAGRDDLDDLLQGRQFGSASQ